MVTSHVFPNSLSPDTTVVIDVGGRYGPHPTWKTFDGTLLYVIFEPDIHEANRLAQCLKTANSINCRRVYIERCAIGNKDGKINLNFSTNRAMSTSLNRILVDPAISNRSVTTGGSESDSATSQEVTVERLDTWVTKAPALSTRVDFLKIDTEGTELEVLQGATKQLDHGVLGVRCEVTFAKVYDEHLTGTFRSVSAFLEEKDFLLLNLDYHGQGHRYSNFVRADSRYGVLVDCDAVFCSSWQRLLSLHVNNNHFEQALSVLKYVTFLFNNNAADLALYCLANEYSVAALSAARNQLEEVQLYRYARNICQHHFYKLKWDPSQFVHDHQNFFGRVFGTELKTGTAYNEDVDLNPFFLCA